ncbi:pre-mRNA-splicing factor 38A-like [Patiria miniata]|uniref:Pre-mRNA-splicing factor 38 n=1 Tax=Patiria miniata TaxID=46514 RepID=A0A913Z9T4_PATMI|nr:pre-mRNA-splicing factor 38A-like [Patiria miniata]
MANRTVKDAHSVKGTNPQYLVEKIIRSRIYESKYWKEECFALTAELLVDKAMELRFIGGTYGGNIKPSPFLCLILKMLQIQPEKDIIIEFIKNEDFKYVRALGAMYMRLTGDSLDIYKYLEPLYNDYRKIRRQNKEGEFYLSHVDEFMDELLHEERVADIILPRLQKRQVLEQTEQLEPRVSALDDDLDEAESSSEDEMDVQESRRSPDRHRSGRHRSPSPRRRRSRSRSPVRRRSRSPRRRSVSPRRERRRSPRRHRSRSRERRQRSKSPGHRHRDRDDDHHRSVRHRSRSPDEHRHQKSSHKSSSRHSRSDKDRDESKRTHKTDEIEAMNELRASLGMGPLK